MKLFNGAPNPVKIGSMMSLPGMLQHSSAASWVGDSDRRASQEVTLVPQQMCIGISL